MKTMLPLMLVALTLLFCTQSFAAGDSTYYDATNSIIDLNNPVGTQWHELYPNYCTGPYTLSGWKDNGDGELSPCDTITMTAPDQSQVCEHVVEVTYTLELTPLQPPEIVNYWDYVYHEQGGDPLLEPICSWWHVVYPDYCMEVHINDWDDTGNGSGVLDSCDVVFDDLGNAYHVEGVHTDIITEPEGGCPTDQSTWSKIKDLFQ
jgi:hypothetical protein